MLLLPSCLGYLSSAKQSTIRIRTHSSRAASQPTCPWQEYAQICEVNQAVWDLVLRPAVMRRVCKGQAHAEDAAVAAERAAAIAVVEDALAREAEHRQAQEQAQAQAAEAEAQARAEAEAQAQARAQAQAEVDAAQERAAAMMAAAEAEAAREQAAAAAEQQLSEEQTAEEQSGDGWWDEDSYGRTLFNVELPALPASGRRLRLLEDMEMEERDASLADSKPTGGSIWPCAAALCRWLGRKSAGLCALELRPLPVSAAISCRSRAPDPTRVHPAQRGRGARRERPGAGGGHGRVRAVRVRARGVARAAHRRERGAAAAAAGEPRQQPAAAAAHQAGGRRAAALGRRRPAAARPVGPRAGLGPHVRGRARGARPLRPRPRFLAPASSPPSSMGATRWTRRPAVLDPCRLSRGARRSRRRSPSC